MAHAACIALYKHSGFKEENEVRIYAYRTNDKAIREAIKAGHKLDKLQAKVQKLENGKKYIELFEGSGIELPIKRIIVGPQSDKQKIADELKGLVDVKIDTSDIPYAEQSWENNS